MPFNFFNFFKENLNILNLANLINECTKKIFLNKLKNKLYGFVRVTSDRGLNANLWNLSALPGNNQQLYYSILLQVTLEKINREMPGCSISVQAPASSFISLEENGFILDPNGIRVMGYKL